MEWTEFEYRRVAGLPLLSDVRNRDPTVEVRGALTASLGVPIATAKCPDAEGTLGFFFHENRDRVLAITCHHVLF